MEELTIEEKAKRYDEAIERANELNYVSDKDSLQCKTVEHIFPELKESEDENIRKFLINEVLGHLGMLDLEGDRIVNNVKNDLWKKALSWLEKQGNTNKIITRNEFTHGVLRGAAINLINWIDSNAAKNNMCLSNMECKDIEDALVSCNWDKIYAYMKKKFEKQGEKSQGKSALEAVKEEKVDNQNCVKPVDEVEPKFKVGDKIQYNKYTYTIKEVQEDCYVLDNDKVLTFNAQDVWELVEKKPVDLVAILKDYFANTPKEQQDKDWEELKHLNDIGPDIEIAFGAKDSELKEATYFIPKGFHAEIDGDKVVIKKGEQNPAWSEDDEKMIDAAIQFAHEYGRHGLWCWLKDLKDRVQPQMQWKAVDKEIYVKEPALAQRKDKSEPNHGYVICYDHTLTPDVYERFIMISDIYNQSHWKPSDEQMKAIEFMVRSFGESGTLSPYGETMAYATSLLNDLKKL